MDIYLEWYWAIVDFYCPSRFWTHEKWSLNLNSIIFLLWSSTLSQTQWTDLSRGISSFILNSYYDSVRKEVKSFQEHIKMNLPHSRVYCQDIIVMFVITKQEFSNYFLFSKSIDFLMKTIWDWYFCKITLRCNNALRFVHCDSVE